MEQGESIETRLIVTATAAQMGLASSLIGATVFLAAPAVAILAAQIWAHGDRTPGSVLLHAWLARIAVCIPILLVLTGAGLGIVGMRRAFRENGPVALPLAGIALNAAGLGGWMLAAIGLLNVTESLLSLIR
jgi:hypothetical protein